MIDIFISYAREDREKAKVLGEALQEQGWLVWWDRQILPGKSFDEVISEALNTAKCIVVLWSKASVTSDWVKEEAAEAARRKVLVPALIEEDVEIPLGFRRIEAALLTDWRGELEHFEFQLLLRSIAELLQLQPKVVRRRYPSERKQLETGVKKQPCTKCGAMILPRTAKKTGGLCMPCYQLAEFKLETGIKKQPCIKCGAMILPRTAKKTGGLCMPCYRLGRIQR